MPASKRELSPPESDSKIRKLDEDGDTMPSKIATVLNTGNSPERTAALRTKKKFSPSPGGNNSRPSSPLSDSSESVSDPPFKKAKLLSTSAFSTVSSEESKSNTSQTQTALTELDEASIGGSSNTDIVRGRDGSDKALCIIQYSNKAKAEEPSELNEELPCSPSDPVQADHSYGRVSEITETDQDGKVLQEFTSLVPESQIPTVTESTEPSTGNLTKREADPSHCVRMHVLERQKPGNIIIESCSNLLDNGTSILESDGKEKQETSSEPQSGNKKLFSEKCLVENDGPNEPIGPGMLTAVQGKGLVQVPTMLVTEEFDQNVKCHTEENYHETLVEEACTDFTMSHALLTKNSESEQFPAVSSSSERHEDNGASTVQSVTNLEQSDRTVQFTFEEPTVLEQMQDQVSNAFTNTTDCVNEITEKFHKNDAEQKIVISSNECNPQNIMSNNEKATNKDQEDHDNNRVNSSTSGVIGDSLIEKEKPNNEDAAILNGQLTVEIPTGERISYAAVEITSCETQSVLSRQTERSSTSGHVKSDCFHGATEAASGMPQNVNEDPTSQNNEMTAVSPASQESLCPVPAVDAQAEIELYTSDQYIKEPVVETFEQQEEIVKHQTKNITHPESSAIIYKEIAVAVNMENSVASEHVSSKIEKETITAEFKDEVESNHDCSAVVPVSPVVPTVDVQGEIQLNTSDQYSKESEVETFQLQEEIVKHQTKNINDPESTENIHQEIVVNMDKSVASEQCTHALSKIEHETMTAESKDHLESYNDTSAAVPVSHPAVFSCIYLSPPEGTSALSPKMCSQYQEVSETSELTEDYHVECSTVTENYNKEHVESLISHSNKQTNVLPHIISASTTDEINPPSVEMCLDVSEASRETQTLMVHNLQSGEIVVSEDQINISSEEMPISSTVVAYERTNPLSRQAEDVEESFISNAFTEHSEDVAEYYTTTDVQTIATSEEISVPTCTVEFDTNNGQEVTTPDSDISDVNKVDIEERSTDCADTIVMELQHLEQDTVEEKVEVMTENVEEQTIAVPEESEVAPSIVVVKEAEHSMPFEVQSDLSHSKNVEGEQMQTESIVVDMLEDNAVISESQEIEGATEYETNKSAVDTSDLQIETKQELFNTEGHVQESQGNEETIIVAYQQEDVHSVEEPNKIATEYDLKKHENQIVYEPISSPESTTDGEVPTLPENNDTVRLVHTDITNTSQIIYSVSALSTDKEIISDGYGVADVPSVPAESSAAISPIEEYEINGKPFQNDKSIRSQCVLDNQTELQSSQTDVLRREEMSKMSNQQLINEEYSDQQVMSEAQIAAEIQSTKQSTAFEQLEQSNGTGDVSVSVTSASEDAPDGKLESTEERSEESVVTPSVFTEQVYAVTETEPVVGTEAATVTFTTENQENQEADGTREEYVILEPVPVTAIHSDIITQAVAASGLSEEINANTESIIAEVQQTSVVKDDVNEQITQETMVVEETMENFEQVEQICISPQHTDMMEVTPANCEPDVSQPVDVNMEPPECQILEDIEIGREIVVAEEEQEEDSDISIIEKPQESTTEEAKKTDENVNETSKETIFLYIVKKDSTTAENNEPEKPKKQEMNTQARTKARLAALAEQKAAASKRQARREQLNLLALCQEIAEDIATDSMLLKKIEEEKQAAAAAAAKSEANKNESSPVNNQEEQPVDLVAPTPERAEVCSPSVTPAEDNTVTQSSSADADDSKAAAEPPKRRFFTSQVSVPLKAHEKKKLTRYQRLRQVELQREKMSWARVKKLKSDQANQMFSDMDWQASMSFSSFAMDQVATASQSVASLSKPPSPGLTSTNKPAPNTEEPKVEVSKPEAVVNEPAKVVMTQTGPDKVAEEKPEADKIESTQKEDSKAEPTKPELRKSSRISKIESSKAASTPAPATKGKATSKKVLPAVPPPMPNGLNNQNLKIEYKPYKPRPKYSPDDFELDDDPIPPPKACPQAKPTHQMRPNVQGRPASQTTIHSKTIATPAKPTTTPSTLIATSAKPTTTSSNPTVSAQSSNQLKSNVLLPAGQSSCQTKLASSGLANTPAAHSLSKGTHATPSSSKILPTTKVLQKTAVSTSPQSKVVASTESKSAASPLSQVKPTSTTSQKEPSLSVDQPVPSETTPAAAPNDAAGPPKCKATEDAPVTSILPKEDSNVSNDTQRADENKEEDKTVTGVHPESKTESEEMSLNKASKLGQDQNVEAPMSDTCLQKEIKKLKDADKDGTQTIIDAGQKHFGPVACSVCGMLYSAANPEDESQHLLFHNQFISAVKYVGWKKERILSEYPDGKIILVLPDDPKYALKKIEEIREMVDNDLGFQQVESKCPSKTKTFLFISNDRKVAGCLIAEHINEGYRVIEELAPTGSEGEKVMFERQRAWCCSTTAEPAICGISRIWVVNTMRRQGIASRMLDCLRNNFIYGSNLSKDEIAFSDPTPDGKLFATHYFGTSQFLVYNFVNGTPTTQAKTEKV